MLITKRDGFCCPRNHSHSSLGYAESGALRLVFIHHFTYVCQKAKEKPYNENYAYHHWHATDGDGSYSWAVGHDCKSKRQPAQSKDSIFMIFHLRNHK